MYVKVTTKLNLSVFMFSNIRIMNRMIIQIRFSYLFAEFSMGTSPLNPESRWILNDICYMLRLLTVNHSCSPRQNIASVSPKVKMTKNYLSRLRSSNIS